MLRRRPAPAGAAAPARRSCTRSATPSSAARAVSAVGVRRVPGPDEVQRRPRQLRRGPDRDVEALARVEPADAEQPAAPGPGRDGPRDREVVLVDAGRARPSPAAGTHGAPACAAVSHRLAHPAPPRRLPRRPGRRRQRGRRAPRRTGRPSSPRRHGSARSPYTSQSSQTTRTSGRGAATFSSDSDSAPIDHIDTTSGRTSASARRQHRPVRPVHPQPLRPARRPQRVVDPPEVELAPHPRLGRVVGHAGDPGGGRQYRDVVPVRAPSLDDVPARRLVPPVGVRGVEAGDDEYPHPEECPGRAPTDRR